MTNAFHNHMARDTRDECITQNRYQQSQNDLIVKWIRQWQMLGKQPLQLDHLFNKKAFLSDLAPHQYIQNPSVRPCVLTRVLTTITPQRRWNRLLPARELLPVASKASERFYRINALMHHLSAECRWMHVENALRSCAPSREWPSPQSRVLPCVLSPGVCCADG